MIIIRGRVATYGELWFDEQLPDDPHVDVITFRQRPTPVDGRASSLFLTLRLDLSQPEDAILAGFGEKNRYKIRRAENKDNLERTFVKSPRADLPAFCDFYDRFAQQKSLERSYRRRLSAACDSGQLVLTRVSRGDDVLVWHAYMTCGNTAALLSSASHYRAMSSNERALIGRANRWLHWGDILGFKQMGLECFDWGGLFEDESVPEHAGINNFKSEFGGRRERTYNCTHSLTIKGGLYLAARNALERLQAFSR